MSGLSRRRLLRTSLLGGVAVCVAPLGSRAYAALVDERLLTSPAVDNGSLKYRVDGKAKVTGGKVFARDIRARDLSHWPQQQAHALALRVTMADRLYAGFDLSMLDTDLKPDRVVTAADLARDGLVFPDFYGTDMLLPEGKTPAYLGQVVALLIFHDFARFRFAKDKLQFNDAVIRYGAVTGPLQRDPWGAGRFVRVGGRTPTDEDIFSSTRQAPLYVSTYDKHQPAWPKPSRDGDLGEQAMFYAQAIDEALTRPPADWLVVTRDYATQSADTAALEPDNANGWYDAARQELHLVVPTQSPQEVAEGAAGMLASSRLGLKRLFLHPCFTVGYGSKDHSPLPYYGLVAAVYGDGRPVRLAYDRFEHFQAGLKRHQFSMRYRIGVERKSGLMQAFQADIVSNGGGRANCSDALTMVAATSAASIYYFPKTDVAATAMSSRALDCGSARGYGALETLAATEIMADEVAVELGLDPIEFRLRNVLKTGMKNAQGAVPVGQQRAETVLQKAQAHALWTGRVGRKQAYDAANPGRYYGVGFGCIQRRFGDGAQCSLAKVELSADGRITLAHTGTEIGTGTSSGQAVACARWLGRPADVLEMAATDWPELPVETSGNPHAMAQEEQDRLAQNPRWVPAFASASSASNSAYYFTHATQAAARVVFLHGLLPAAVAIWGRDVKAEAVRWRDGALTADGLEPMPLARLASDAHARGLVTGATVHAFNRWQWAEADFEIDGAKVRLPLDALSLRRGAGKDWRVLDRRAVFLPPTTNNNTMVGYNTCVGTLVEIAVEASSGKVLVLNHHTILECGNMLVPELVSGQMQGCLASGIGLALYEEMPLYEDGPGNGTWNFNRYYLPRGSDVAVWQQTAEVLPPLSDSEPPKGMAEVVMIPIMAGIVNGIAHAVGHRFRTLPVTPERILKVLG